MEKLIYPRVQQVLHVHTYEKKEEKDIVRRV